MMGPKERDIQRRLRVIKLDIEGFEFAVLEKTALAPAGNPIIFTEVSDQCTVRAGGSVDKLDRLLRQAGYFFLESRQKPRLE